jgi:4-hydroxy-tetrahydrodipicolinate synthase
MKPITGSIVALVTPMHDDGSVDYDALRRLIDWQIGEGTQCIGVVGTTGESPTVTVEEHCEIIRVAVEQTRGRVAVMAGTGANSTAEAIELSRFALKVGADCTLSVVPLLQQAVAGRHLPPLQGGRRGRRHSDGRLQRALANGRRHAGRDALRLAQVPGVIGIKDATGDIERGSWLIKNAPAGFSIYSGDDGTAVALMLLGAHGNVSVTANVAPRAMQALCAAALAGNAREAARLQLQLLGLHKALFVEPSPAPTKFALERLGRCRAAVRLPILPLGEPGRAVVDAALREAGLA